SFATIRWAQPLSLEVYREEVRQAAKRGWAMDDGHFSGGILAIAAPVYSPTNSIDFTVSAVMFRGQRDEEGLAELGKALIEFCNEVAGVLY
ncbi:IclR family transcriptional regulator, partial [Pseudomonas sp. MWU13-2860]